jgi:hypothetical protein
LEWQEILCRGGFVLSENLHNSPPSGWGLPGGGESVSQFRHARH